MLLLGLTSCKTFTPFKTDDYLILLASSIGLSQSDDLLEAKEALDKWGVINKEETVEEILYYDYLKETIENLIAGKADFIKKTGKEPVERKDAVKAIEKAKEIINNQTFKTKYEVKEKEGVIELKNYLFDGIKLVTDQKLEIGDYVFLRRDDVYKKVTSISSNSYLLDDVTAEEVFSDIEIEDSYFVNFETAEIITEGEEKELYVNLDRSLLASEEKKTFFKDGFKVSYNFKASGIDIRVSKNVDYKNMFFDISINSIKPSFKWDYKEGKLNEAYFKVDYNTNEELGVSTGKYNNYYLDLKDKNSSDFLSYIKKNLKKNDDEIETTLKICEIKTPVPNMPTIFFNIDVLAKIYSSGKAEIVLANKHAKGMEIKNGVLRVISETDRDIDFKIGGSSRAVLGLNFNLEATKTRLMDVEIDAGIRAALSTTLHLYDKDGQMNSVESDLSYSTVDELAKENNDVRVCGDISLNWVLDLNFNTSKTLLSKMGFSKSKSVLDGDNQVFGNKTHIENMQLVKSCTRKNRFKNSDKNSIAIKSDKIILDKYSKVIKLNETYLIPIKSLPEGVKKEDLIFTSQNEQVAKVDQSGLISGLKTGSCVVSVASKDGRYSANIDVLVSGGWNVHCNWRWNFI